MRRVVVSGAGVVSPLGNDPASIYAAARDGQSGIDLYHGPMHERLATAIVAKAHFDAAEHFDAPRRRLLDRFSQFAVYAADQAIEDSAGALDGLNRELAGVFIGTGVGGSQSLDSGYQTLYQENSDRIWPFTVIAGMHNAAAAWVGIDHGLLGPNLTYSTACSSSTVAIGEAWLRIASGQLEVAIAGGAEAPLTPGSLKAWEALRTLATPVRECPSSSCKPFSLDRTGMVLGEGAAMMVLEPHDRASARGARIYGEIIGYGVTNDALHITQPDVEGQARTMRAALHSANADPGAIDAINAHGTGTKANDYTETAAIRTIFGTQAERLPISATKAIHGHLLGATGALETLLSLLAMQHDTLLPTMHLTKSDPDCDLDYVSEGMRPNAGVRTMLMNSFAFGGSNAVLALRATG